MALHGLYCADCADVPLSNYSLAHFIVSITLLLPHCEYLQFLSIHVLLCGCASMGDGLSFPVRTIDEDYDSLLGQRQRWMEDGDVYINGTVNFC